MKVLVIGGTGHIGSKVVSNLRHLGHHVIAGSPSTGINTITTEGLADALKGADVVVDISNSPSLEEPVAIDFFQTSGHNLLKAAVSAGVKHHLVLSIVGVDLISEGYLAAKKVQEKLVKGSGLPYTIIRSTQFFEFVPIIAAAALKDGATHVSNISFQPIAADDVTKLILELALTKPANGIVEIAGPELLTMSDFVALYRKQTSGVDDVIVNQNSQYFEANIPSHALVPQGVAKLGSVSFDKWLSSQPNCSQK
jgi:uncharacterized protein YbjT (DUF2867 family)